MAEGRQSIVIYKKTDFDVATITLNYLPILTALKNREYDGRFKKGTRIRTVQIINVASLALRPQLMGLRNKGCTINLTPQLIAQYNTYDF